MSEPRGSRSTPAPAVPAGRAPTGATFAAGSAAMAATFAAGDDGGLDLRAMLGFARRWWRTILGIGLIGTAGAAFYAYSKVPLYTARALVMIKPEDSRVVDVEAVMAGLGSDSTTIETQIRFLSSREMLESLADRLQLAKAPPAALPEPGLMQRAVADLRQTVEGWLGQDWLVGVGIAREPPQQAPEVAAGLALEDAAAGLAERLQVRQEGRSLVLAIAYTSPSPAEAARIANGLAALYVESQVSEKVAATQKAGDWLEQRLGELQGELVAVEGEAEAFRAENELLATRGITMQSQQIANLTTMLVETRAQLSEKRSRLDYIGKLGAGSDSLNALGEVLDSPYMARLWDQDQELGRRAAELRNEYGAKHPQVASLRAEQAKVVEKMRQEVGRIVANIGNEVDMLASREASLQADIDGLLRQSDEAGRAEVKLRELERQAAASRELYENFLLRYKETREQEQLAEPNARVIAAAKLPELPTSTPPVYFVLLGFVGSSALGALFGWLMERLDTTLRSSKDIERLLGVPCLGLVPQVTRRMRKGSPSLHDYLVARPLSIYAETVRSIYTALRAANVDRPPKVIHVTSSAPGEGKTVMAVSLAVSLARSGFKTVLVDLDLRHPSVGREVALPDGGRLVAYLLGDATLDEVTVHDANGKIDVLGVGEPSSNPTALVSSQRLQMLLLTLRERYDYVILDSPPALGVSDTKIVAKLADTTLFLLRWGETTRDTAEDALKDLAVHGVAVAGAVMTQVDMARHARYGYGGIDHYYTKYNKYYRN